MDRLKFIFAVVFVSLFVSGLCVAQEQKDLKMGFGMVLKVSENEIVLLEYDVDADQDIEVVYKIDFETALENIQSLSELQIDDEAGIEYVIESNEKKAVVIIKFKDEETEVGSFEAEPQEGEGFFVFEEDQDDSWQDF